MPQPTNPLISIASHDVTLSLNNKNKNPPPSNLETLGYTDEDSVDGDHLNYILDNLLQHLSWAAEKVEIVRKLSQDMRIKISGYYLGGSENPATVLGYGNWVALDSNVALRSGVTDTYLPVGSSTATVQLPEHTHVANTHLGANHAHSYTIDGAKLEFEHTGNHSHGVNTNVRGYHYNFNNGVPATFAAIGDTHGAGTPQPSGTVQDGLLLKSDGVSHNHYFSGITTSSGGHSHDSFTMNDSGVDDPTIDLKGKHISIIMWRRVS